MYEFERIARLVWLLSLHNVCQIACAMEDAPTLVNVLHIMMPMVFGWGPFRQYRSVVTACVAHWARSSQHERNI